MDIVIAAGVESMTRVPMGSPSILASKAGMGHYKSPGMEARYPNIQFSQFTGAEMVAEKYGLSKDDLDTYAFESHQRAIAATEAGRFKDEIIPLQITRADGTTDTPPHIDEGIRFDATLDGIAGVKLIAENGKLTAASASQICDGASGVMVVNEKALKQLGVKPLARIHHMTMMGGDPGDHAGSAAARHQARAGKGRHEDRRHRPVRSQRSLRLGSVAWLQATGADPERLNVNGGAIALGHPLGASGTKLMTTLVHALQQRGKRYGLQTMCEGGGMANVTIVERLFRQSAGRKAGLDLHRVGWPFAQHAASCEGGRGAEKPRAGNQQHAHVPFACLVVHHSVLELAPRARRIGRLLVERLPVAHAAAHELRPVGHDEARVALVWQQRPEIGVVPAQVVAARIPVLPNGGAELADFSDERVAGECIEVFIHRVNLREWAGHHCWPKLDPMQAGAAGRSRTQACQAFSAARRHSSKPRSTRDGFTDSMPSASCVTPCSPERWS
jgi:acetyl-CoA C-acetyltransferase